LTFMFASCY